MSKKKVKSNSKQLSLLQYTLIRLEDSSDTRLELLYIYRKKERNEEKRQNANYHRRYTCGDRWFIFEAEQKTSVSRFITRWMVIGSLIGRRNVTTTIKDRSSANISCPLDYSFLLTTINIDRVAHLPRD